MGSRRHLRLEEYASSGPSTEPEDVRHALSNVQVRPMQQPSRSASKPSLSAASSHRQTDRYLEAFDAAFEELSAAEAARTGQPRQETSPLSLLPSVAPSLTRSQLQDTSRGSAADLTPDLSGAWTQGPHRPKGQLHAVSAQPLVCMSMSADEREVVVGSSDHALYVVPLGGATSSNARVKTLYTKTFGHQEWVTCVAHLPDRRIVSGGMDSKLCLWDATGVKCEDLRAHSGSVSCVLSLGDELVLSAGYDKTLRLWNVSQRTSSRQRERSAVKAGTAPILDVALLGGHKPSAVSGDRDGGVQLIDLKASKVVRKHAKAHRGHTTSVLGSQSGGADSGGDLYFSGGQDGAVNVWDTRQKAATCSLDLHIDHRSGKSGAVGFLREPAQDPNVLLTGGADGVINVLDKRQSYGVLHRFTEHMDFIYSVHVRGQLCFSGAGNGMLHVHDWREGKLLYGLGANQAAVRAVAASATQLVAAGDDGGVIVYDTN